MGYYTRYTLHVDGPPNAKNKFEEAFTDDKIIATSYNQPLSDLTGLDNYDADSCKWYDSEKDLAEISLEWPTLLFTLKGEGEEAGDVWQAWVKNGRYARTNAVIVLDPPDDVEWLAEALAVARTGDYPAESFDADETLNEIRRLSAVHSGPLGDTLLRLVTELDTHLQNGGSLPISWTGGN